MPLYLWKCPLCAKTEEVIRSVGTMDDPMPCPCCAEPMARVPFPGCAVYIEPIGELWE